MRRDKAIIPPVAEKVKDGIFPINFVRTDIQRNNVQILVNGENGVQFKFRSQTGVNKISAPHSVHIYREGAEGFRLVFFYLPGEAPRHSNKENGLINTSLFDRNDFIVQTGTDPATGKAKGQLYSNLICSGWAYKTGLRPADEQRYEQIVCITQTSTDWDNKPINLDTLGDTPRKAKATQGR